MIQETFTTAALIYFAYSYFDKTHELLPQKTLDKTTKQFKDVYQKTRYHLTFPLILTALKMFGEVKRAKKSVQSEVRDFISSDGFNIENAQRLTQGIGVFVEKIKNLSALISGGFDSVKSWASVLDTKADFSAPLPSSSQKSAVRSPVSVKSRPHRTKASAKISAPKNK
ncbi:MAG: hypothetical protein ACI4QM_01880 [Alphaproteobacteria bacterium]